MRVRPLFDEFAHRVGAFTPAPIRRGYLYGRPGPEPLTQFLLLDNSRVGISVYVCSTILGRFSNELGGSAARSTAQLSYLREGGPTPVSDLIYAHASDDASIRGALDSISRDLEAVARPWFARAAKQVEPGHLLHEGLRWLAENEAALAELSWEGFRAELMAVNGHYVRVWNPTFIEMKRALRKTDAFSRAPKSERRTLSSLAYTLLEYAMESTSQP